MIDPQEPRPPIPGVHFREVEKGALSDADVARMLELLTLAFGRWPTVDASVPPGDHLRWKASSPATICAAVLGESGETLVTTATAMGFPMLLRGRPALRIQFVDQTVRPEWRGRGVSSAEIAYRQRVVAPRYDLSISDAQSPAMIRRGTKFGTRRFGNEIHPLVLPLAHRRFAERKTEASGLPASLARPLSLLLDARRAMRRRRRGPAFESSRSNLLAVSRVDDRFDDFFAVAGKSWDLIMTRSRSHFDWRYCDPRAGSFCKLVAVDAGAILGYVVGSARGEDGFLVDLLAVPDRLDVASDLVAELARRLERRGCAEVLCWLPRRHPYRDVLHRAGFLDVRRIPSVTFRPGRAAPEDLDFLTAPDARIHFMLGDTDLV